MDSAIAVSHKDARREASGTKTRRIQARPSVTSATFSLRMEKLIAAQGSFAPANRLRGQNT
jgi:hypothetical protein